MNSIRSDHQSITVQTKNGQADVKKVPQDTKKISTNAVERTQLRQNAQLAPTPNGVNTKHTPLSRLSQLLQQMNVLQRLFTTINPASNTSTPPVASPLSQLFSQLLQPSNQALLIRWLQQGAGKNALIELLAQSQDPNSALRQWLGQQPQQQQEETLALLKLAIEQRLAPLPPSREPESIVLYWPLLQPSGREARIAVYQQHQEKRNGQPGKPKWKVTLSLPIATNESLEATANWNGEQLDLLFESDNGHVIRKTEQLAPMLEARLEMLGLKANSIQYNQLEPAPLTPTATTTSGILVTV